MGIKIEAIPDSCRLRVSGDIETVVVVPYEDDDRFMIGLSEGTLLVGSYDDALHCRFDVARNGAGFVRFEHGAALVDWRGVEWAAVSIYDPNVVEPADPKPMPLFPDLGIENRLN